MNTAGGVFYRATEWITRLAYLNLLWIGFTLAGVIVLGFFPSTTAMFAVVREWLKGNTDIPVFRTFWDFYKKDFWKSNLLGVVILIIGLLLYADFLFLQYNDNSLFSWMIIPFYLFLLFFVLFLFYVFPAFVHFDLNIRGIMKNAFLIMLINPLTTILMLICLASLFIIMDWLPALAFIFGGSACAFITMWLGYVAFNRTRQKQS